MLFKNITPGCLFQHLSPKQELMPQPDMLSTYVWTPVPQASSMTIDHEPSHIHLLAISTRNFLLFTIIHRRHCVFLSSSSSSELDDEKAHNAIFIFAKCKL